MDLARIRNSALRFTRRSVHAAHAPAGTLALSLMLALAASTPPDCRAQTTIVAGCNELVSGEIGVRELMGSVGDTVSVAVTAHTISPVSAFGLDLEFPEALLGYVDLAPGDLTAGFTNLSAQASGGVVTIGGFTLGTAIPTGAAGRLAHVRFVVLAPGASAFSTSRFVDAIQGYASCEDEHGPSAIAPSTWSRVKSLFQAPLPGSR
jgi:hypothetical protein